ncbi:membrane protein [Sneathiella chinensis]|uniref:Membrane protein n=1 Tax=Sneathiella chinensis TaxID=349750 RepID=A0ABQ5U551_9PROT|nr:RDD family protein [Sneathiella chinensis]GLQ06447.1 membrane protein [Sneathiella chinensis]
MITLSSLDGLEEETLYTEQPDDFDGVRSKRVFAYIIDLVCIFFLTIAANVIAALMGIISLGTLTPILVLAITMVPLGYHTLTVGSQWNATVGMRMMGLEVCLLDGREPDYITAFLHAALFYVTMALTSFLLLAISLFNAKGRLLHDFITNSVIKRSHPKPA